MDDADDLHGVAFDLIDHDIGRPGNDKLAGARLASWATTVRKVAERLDRTEQSIGDDGRAARIIARNVSAEIIKIEGC